MTETARKQLLADLQAILRPFPFCPTIKGILQTIETGDLVRVCLTVNLALSEKLIGSHTVRNAVRAWCSDVNAAGGA